MQFIILIGLMHSNKQRQQNQLNIMSMDPQPPSFMQPNSKKSGNNKQQAFPTTINDLTKRITDSYNSLQSKYSQSSSKNQTYLLTIYLKVLDKVLDQVVYAQERVRMVDNETLKEEKCTNYLNGIAQYRDQCYEIKSQLQQNKLLLKQERKKTDDLLNQRNQLMHICQRKDDELEVLKRFVQRQKQLKNLSKNKMIKEQAENQELLENQNHHFLTKVIKNKKQKKAKPLHTPQKKRTAVTRSKSFRGKKCENEEALNSISADLQEEEKKEKIRNKPNRLKKLSIIDHLPVDRMNETLWLYQPSSYRKTKYLNPNIHMKNILAVGAEQDRKLKISLMSQDSTKNHSSVDQSHNISQRSTERSKPQL